jgi:hypothetical protein
MIAAIVIDVWLLGPLVLELSMRASLTGRKTKVSVTGAGHIPDPPHRASGDVCALGGKAGAFAQILGDGSSVQAAVQKISDATTPGGDL